MTGAMVIRWGAVIHGREQMSLDVFGKAIGQFEGLAKAGRIHGHREYLRLTGLGGGFLLAEGEVPELLKLVADPEILKLTAQAGAVVEDFDIQVFAGGSDQSVQEMIGTFSSAMQGLDLM